MAVRRLKAADPKPGQKYPFVAKVIESSPAYGKIDVNQQIVGPPNPPNPFQAAVSLSVQFSHVG